MVLKKSWNVLNLTSSLLKNQVAEWVIFGATVYHFFSSWNYVQGRSLHVEEVMIFWCLGVLKSTEKVLNFGYVITAVTLCSWYYPLSSCNLSPPANRVYLISDACLEGKREDNQNCSVLYCVRQLWTMICIHVWAGKIQYDIFTCAQKLTKLPA